MKNKIINLGGSIQRRIRKYIHDCKQTFEPMPAKEITELDKFAEESSNCYAICTFTFMQKEIQARTSLSRKC